MIAATVPASSLLNLDYINARTLLLAQTDHISLVLIGCGGTGSWLAPHLVRVARLLIEQGKHVDVYFVDPDHVEQKNIYRQNFCDAEVGLPKAEALAYRYSLAWGVDIQAVADYVHNVPIIGSMEYPALPLRLLIGCVDSPTSRAQIYDVLKYKNGLDASLQWWLDCGNEHSTGQVILGGGNQSADPWKLPGHCACLPLPSQRHPDLVNPSPAPEKSSTISTALSCADIALMDAQGLVINQQIAAVAADYLVRLLITRNLQKWGTYIDLASGSTRSMYIVPEGDKS